MEPRAAPSDPSRDPAGSTTRPDVNERQRTSEDVSHESIAPSASDERQTRVRRLSAMRKSCVDLASLGRRQDIVWASTGVLPCWEREKPSRIASICNISRLPATTAEVLLAAQYAGILTQIAALPGVPPPPFVSDLALLRPPTEYVHTCNTYRLSASSMSISRHDPSRQFGPRSGHIETRGDTATVEVKAMCVY